LTESGDLEHAATNPTGYLVSGASNYGPVSMAPGTHTFSTIIRPDTQGIATNAQSYTTTTVLLTDNGAPAPPHDVCFDAAPAGACD
jgi:hypothetical protein